MIFRKLKRPFYLARAYFNYGEMLMVFSLGNRSRETKTAHKYLQKAMRIFQEIGAGFWLKKVYKLQCQNLKSNV